MDRLNINDTLAQNQVLNSPNRNFSLKQQDDGNLVIYDNRSKNATWHSNTATGGANKCIMQGDGNFVVYDGSGTPIWAAKSNRDNFQGCLILNDDGKLLIVDQVFDVTNAPARQ